MEKELNKLSKEKLISLVKTMIADEELNFVPHNKVSVCDVEVESNVESLEGCKNIADDLINKNHEFITLRKNKINAERFGYFG